MRRAFWLAASALLPWLCQAQTFGSMRIVSDGTLFFSSIHQPMGEFAPYGLRLYSYSGGVIRLFPNATGLFGFDISSDGGVVALNRSVTSTIVNAQGEEWMKFPSSSIRLSANGRYAAVEKQSTVSLVEIAGARTLWTVDRATLAPGRVVSGGGAVLALRNGAPVLLRDGEAQPLNVELETRNPNPWPSSSTIIEESGRSMAVLMEGKVYLKVFSSSATIPLSLASIAGLLEYTSSALTCFRPTEIVRLPLDGRPAETLLSVSSPFITAAASQDRFFTANASRLQQHTHGVASTVASAFSFTQFLSRTAPGAIVEWTLPTGLPFLPPVSPSPPYPLSVGAFRIALAGIPAPIVSVEQFETQPGSRGNKVRFLIPWNLPQTGPVTVIPIVMQTEEGIPLASPAPPQIYLARRDPKFLREFSVLRAAHSNGAPVTASNPAVPGAAVRLFLSGLGEVTPLPPNDRPPAEPLPLIAPLECYVSNGQESRKILPERAALSTSQTGVFDVLLSLPSLPSRGEFYVGCEVEGYGDSGAIPVRVTP